MTEFLIFMQEQWLLFGLLFALVSVYFWREKARGGRSLSVHEVTRLINSDRAVILDLRDVQDFKSGHIVDAINIPYRKVSSVTAEGVAQLEPYRDKVVVLVDKMGQHVGHVGRVLRLKGFDICRLQGGMMEWQNLNLPLTKKG